MVSSIRSPAKLIVSATATEVKLYFVAARADSQPVQTGASGKAGWTGSYMLVV